MADESTLTPNKGGATGGQWQDTFIAALRNSGNIRASCLAAGISRETAYKERRRLATFAKRWDEALEESIDLLEAAARQRAMNISDTLLIFLLKAHRPDKYGEKVRLELFIRQTAEQLAAEAGMTAEQLIAEAERILAHA
jgi:hypothetical protein